MLCRIPNWWKGTTSGLSLKISVGDSQPVFVGMNAVLSFDPKLFLGDEEISEAEARQLLRETDGLAYIKNRWVAADPEKLRRTLDAYEKAKNMAREEGISLREALRIQLNPEKFLGIEENGTDTGVSNGEWLESVIRKLGNPNLTPFGKTTQHIQGTTQEISAKRTELAPFPAFPQVRRVSG